VPFGIRALRMEGDHPRLFRGGRRSAGDADDALGGRTPPNPVAMRPGPDAFGGVPLAHPARVPDIHGADAGPRIGRASRGPLEDTLKILVTAASRHGSTVEIAASIGATLRAAGHEVFVVTPSEIMSLAGYDAAVIGSGVYMGRWLEAARYFIEVNKSSLRAMPVWLFASGPIGVPTKPAGEPEEAHRLVELTQAAEYRTFPGAIDRAKLGFAERAIMSAIRAPEGDFRQWAEIEAWARGIAAALSDLGAGGPGSDLKPAARREPVLAGVGR
jgi:menaquinone-dependent protoporphyrinogen oxidase